MFVWEYTNVCQQALPWRKQTMALIQMADVPAYRRRARGRCPTPRAESRPYGFDP